MHLISPLLSHFGLRWPWTLFVLHQKSEGGLERSPERSVTEQRARRAAEDRIRDRQTGHGSQAEQQVTHSHCQDERPETQVDGQTVPGGPGEHPADPCVDRRSRLPQQEAALEELLTEERHSPAQCGTKPEPPPQRTKPCLSTMTQRHLQDSSGTALLSLACGLLHLIFFC